MRWVLTNHRTVLKSRAGFLNVPTPASFCLFSFFSSTIFTENTAGVSGIWTRIVGIEGEPADQLTTTTAIVTLL